MTSSSLVFTYIPPSKVFVAFRLEAAVWMLVENRVRTVLRPRSRRDNAFSSVRHCSLRATLTLARIMCGGLCVCVCGYVCSQKWVTKYHIPIRREAIQRLFGWHLGGFWKTTSIVGGGLKEHAHIVRVTSL